MIRPLKDHKLKPLRLHNFFPKNSCGFRKKLEKTEGVKLTPLVFPGLKLWVIFYAIILQLVRQKYQQICHTIHWFNKTNSDLQAYFGCLFNNRNVPLPRHRLHMAGNPLMMFIIIIISNAMIHNHFEEPMSYVHVAEKTWQLVTDSLKFGRALTALTPKFLVSSPEEHIQY